MRPFLALYVGGMGSREKNFYNALVQRYGFEDEARDVQDLYLEGKREEAMARLSDELIDTVSLVRPARRTCASASPSTATPASARSGSARWRSRSSERLAPAAPDRGARRLSVDRRSAVDSG